MSISRKHILVFADWYLPGFKAGGPIRSVANLVQSLDLDFSIVTRNKDHFSEVPYEGIVPNTWIQLEPNVRVIYFEENKVNEVALTPIICDPQYDKILLNSLFSALFSRLPLSIIKTHKLQSKTILAPRGMLKAGALSIKPLKKKVFLALSRWTGNFDGITWMATNEQEASEIRRHISTQATIRICPNLAFVPKGQVAKPIKHSGELNLVSIARISPEKGILESLTYLRNAKLEGKVSLVIYGTQQNAGYLEQCRSMASEISNAEIRFGGEINPHQVAEALRAAHFFYMTTLGENYGHAIIESLVNATPVIISDCTPWRNLQQANAGWDTPLESSAVVPVLRKAIEMGDASYQKMSTDAFSYGRSNAEDPSVLRQAYAIFA